LLLLAAMGSFITSTVLSESVTSDMQRRTATIAGDDLPSMEYLTSLRTDLFRAAMILERDTQAGAAEHDVLLRELEEVRNSLSRALSAYQRLPASPGEAALASEMRDELADVERDLDDLLSRGRGPIEREDIVDRLGPALERAQTTSVALIRLNGDEAERATEAITRERTRAVRGAYALDGLSALLTVLVALLAWRTVRYYLDTLERQRKLVADRAEELEAFAGRVAHDILNPLNAVGLSLDLLDRNVPRETVVPRARSSLKRVHRIIDALLAFARAGARPDPAARCDVEQVLKGIATDVAEQAAERGIDLKLEIASDLEAACHPGVLASIAGNLLTNAIKYLGANNPVRRVVLRSAEQDGSVRVEIQDTGPGIAPALQTTLFEPYVRGKDNREPGIGLGLATAKKLCDAHGGRIGLKSELGRGSTFWFELPLAARPQPALPQSQPELRT